MGRWKLTGRLSVSRLNGRLRILDGIEDIEHFLNLLFGDVAELQQNLAEQLFLAAFHLVASLDGERLIELLRGHEAILQGDFAEEFVSIVHSAVPARRNDLCPSG